MIETGEQKAERVQPHTEEGFIVQSPLGFVFPTLTGGSSTACVSNMMDFLKIVHNPTAFIPYHIVKVRIEEIPDETI